MDDPTRQPSAPAGALTAPPRIGELLLERGLVRPEQLEAALDLQRHSGLRLGETLVNLGFVSSFDVTRVLAERLGLEFLDLADTPIDPVVAQSVPEEVARRYRVLPVGHRESVVVVAMADPHDVFAIDDLRMLMDAPVVAVMADPAHLATAIDRAWAGSDIATSLQHAGDDLDDHDDVAELVAVAEDAPIVRLVNSIVARAVEERASDVHLEPGADRVRIRFRVDGVLHDSSEAPLKVHRPAMSRLKIMAGIDITQNRTPQDGRFSVTVHERHIDVRMATLPTATGEAAVLRLLDQTEGVMELGRLGFEPEELERFEPAFRASQGAILASGPTGSGKTSTLYATVVELNSPGTSIISVEDPIEYRIDGIKQMGINPRAGLTFAGALRAILRADPDVILVGEIRDLETARIAAEASLTGHLVLSTIHTTRAAAVPLRLLDMGVEPFLVTSALTCVVGQRLVRRLCERCCEPDEPNDTVRVTLGVPDDLVDSGSIRRAVGCPHCAGTGYHGRVAVYEVMPMTEDVGRLVIGRASTAEIERWAVAEGMDTLRMAALRRVGAGVLSLDEMVRVIT